MCCAADGCATPTIAVLHEDAKEQRHVKTYAVSLHDKELVEGPWQQQNLDPGAAQAGELGGGDAVVWMCGLLCGAKCTISTVPY